MRHRSAFGLALAVAAASAVGTDAEVLGRDSPSSNLDLEMKPLCVMGPEGNFSNQVEVFVHADNSRYLELGDDMSGTQTRVPCDGELPKSCLKGFQAEGSPPPCAMIECPCERNVSRILTEYGQKMMETLIPACQGSTEFRVLNIGLGAGGLPPYLLAHCPTNTVVDSVEFDPRIIAAGERFFGTDDAHGRHEISSGDGGAAIAERFHAGKHYDAIVVDAFDADGNVPRSCSDAEFLGHAQAILRPGGKLVMQVWSRQYPEVLERFEKRFGASNVVGNDVHFGQWVIAATNAREPANSWALVQRAVRGSRRGAP